MTDYTVKPLDWQKQESKKPDYLLFIVLAGLIILILLSAVLKDVLITGVVNAGFDLVDEAVSKQAGPSHETESSAKEFNGYYPKSALTELLEGYNHRREGEAYNVNVVIATEKKSFKAGEPVRIRVIVSSAGIEPVKFKARNCVRQAHVIVDSEEVRERVGKQLDEECISKLSHREQLNASFPLTLSSRLIVNDFQWSQAQGVIEGGGSSGRVFYEQVPRGDYDLIPFFTDIEYNGAFSGNHIGYAPHEFPLTITIN